MYIEGIYLGTEIDSTFDNMMSSVADYTGSVKTNSPRSFLVELSQAVERSKIIIAIGELYGKNGLINIMSKGLDLPMTAVDWKSMGIAPIMNTLLPKDAVPLLAADDSLAGMILESGSQSIIVLNENAETRAQMLEMYIEAYIGARSTEPDADNDFFESDGDEEQHLYEQNATVETDNSAEILLSDDTDAVDETADAINEDFADVTEITDTITDVSDTTETADADAIDADSDTKLVADEDEPVAEDKPTDYTEPTDEDDSTALDNEPTDDADINADQNGDYDDQIDEEHERYLAEKASGDRVGFIEEEDFVLEDEPKKVKKHKKAGKLLLPIIAAVLVLAVIGGYFGYLYAYLPYQCKNDYITLREYKDDMGSGKIPQEISLAQYGRLYEINNDMLGWLTIEGTNIDYPIVSSAKTGSNYYKNHTFSGVKGTFGTPYFTGEYGIHSAYPRNLAVFGNNTGDGNMFSDLEKYLDPDFFKSHVKITMNSILYDDEWKVVSVMLMDKSLTTAAVNYTESFADKTEIDSDYISALSTYSAIALDTKIETSDHLLSLITSYSKDDNKNVVVTAKRITNR
ncbi:MAG: sortase [Clostridia bacterium]|nr:sortase [Clostridia bacterium]